MIKLFILLHLIFLIFITDVRAQVLLGSHGSTKFKLGLALVTGFLSGTIFLVILLLLYAKFCHRRRPNNVRNARERIRGSVLPTRPRALGVDRAVIESLPFFRFSSIEGSRDGLDCTVCLSKFEDDDMLRLLPKCQHAFHVGCIDQWLESRSTCPLCRRKVSLEVVSELPCSDNLRSMMSQSGELREESTLEQYVQREENGLASSRLSIDRSFSFWSQRRAGRGELSEQQSVESDQFKKRFHRFNHRVLGNYSDVVFKNRWSNVTSSDLVSLNAEFLNDASSARFMSEESMEIEEIQKENYQMVSTINQSGHRFLNFPGPPTTSDSSRNIEFGSNFPYPIDKRSMSEIVVHPRFTEFEDNTDSYLVHSERTRRLWISIARKTAQWYTNRESRTPNSQGQ